MLTGKEILADDEGTGVGDVEGEASGVAPSLSGGSADTERVVCPIGREFIPSSDYCINTHLVQKGSSFSLLEGTTSVSTDTSPNADSSTTLVVETVLVGQRFRENFKLQEGMSITILRDPQNAKDRDAIKVLYGRSDCGQMLGYVPQLAKVLAPLLDTHFIPCEGKQPLKSQEAHASCESIFIGTESNWNGWSFIAIELDEFVIRQQFDNPM
ncbi:fanconi-associated nuclease 1 [Hordeum vulgare]|nr:fanconi-associated nuclease 1 [Hordeum vulgare]